MDENDIRLAATVRCVYHIETERSGTEVRAFLANSISYYYPPGG